MDAGGDAATPGPPAATSAMSVDEAWDLKQGERQPLAQNRAAILADIKRKLENTKLSPVQYLEKKYHSATEKGEVRAGLVAGTPTHGKKPSAGEGRLAWQAGGVVDGAGCACRALGHDLLLGCVHGVRANC